MGIGVRLVTARGYRSGDVLGNKLVDAALRVPMRRDELGAVGSKGSLALENLSVSHQVQCNEEARKGVGCKNLFEEAGDLSIRKFDIVSRRITPITQSQPMHLDHFPSLWKICCHSIPSVRSRNERIRSGWRGPTYRRGGRCPGRRRDPPKVWPFQICCGKQREGDNENKVDKPKQ